MLPEATAAVSAGAGADAAVEDRAAGPAGEDRSTAPLESRLAKGSSAALATCSAARATAVLDPWLGKPRAKPEACCWSRGDGIGGGDESAAAVGWRGRLLARPSGCPLPSPLPLPSTPPLSGLAKIEEAEANASLGAEAAAEAGLEATDVGPTAVTVPAAVGFSRRGGGRAGALFSGTWGGPLREATLVSNVTSITHRGCFPSWKLVRVRLALPSSRMNSAALSFAMPIVGIRSADPLSARYTSFFR